MDRSAKFKLQVANGFFWIFMERICAQGVTFVVSVLLARLLFPEDYGLIAIAQIFINIANVFVSHGLNTALIQKDDVDDIDYSTAFYTTLVTTIFIYCLFFYSAPHFSKWMGLDQFTGVFRVLSLRIIIGSINTIQRAYVSRHMLFKRFFFSTFLGTIISAVVGIGMALNGFGAWAIVGQYLTNVVIDSVVLWFTVEWRPIFAFSKEKMICMVNFSLRLLLAELLNEIYLEIRAIVIGKKYSSNELAYFNRGKQFPQLFFTNIVSAIVTVIFPVMANEKNDLLLLKKELKTIIGIASHLLFPLMMIIFVSSEKLVGVILTDKWLPCVPYLKIYCICYALLPIQSILEQLYKALGRSDIVFNLFMIEKTVGVMIILLTMKHGVLAIAIGMLCSALISTIVHLIPINGVLDCTICETLGTMFVNALFTCVAAVISYIVGLFIFSDIIAIIAQLLVFLLIYISMSYCFKSKSLLDIIQILNGFFGLSIFLRIEEKLR